MMVEQARLVLDQPWDVGECSRALERDGNALPLVLTIARDFQVLEIFVHLGERGIVLMPEIAICFQSS
jgi:hypothetical protein